MRAMHRDRRRSGFGPRRPGFRHARFGDDSGMTLIELMWALMVFAIAATAIAYGIITATNTVRLNKDRVEAANLASREMEITRSEFMNSGTGAADLGATSMVVNPHPLPAGTAPELLKYTVVRHVEWLPAGSGTSACDGGSTVNYPSLAVSVSVTWPRMGPVQPVASNTVLTPPKGTLNSTLGFVAIKVLRADGTPAEGQAVSLSGPSSVTRYTAEDGCAVFALSSFGTYSAKLSTPGYVDNFGVSVPTKTVIAKASTLAQASFFYDRAATLVAKFKAPSGGYALPTSLPAGFYLYNTGIVPSGTRYVPAAGGTTTLGNLWPYPDGYAMWAGSCTQSDPAKAGGTRAANTVIAPGATANANLQLQGLTVTALNVDGDPLPGATVIATPQPGSISPFTPPGCVAPETSGWAVGQTGSDGVLKTSLPAGAWTLSIAGKTPDDAWPTTPNLVPGGSDPGTVVQIATSS